MKPQDFHLTFITPCFCAGANPSVAEVRAPSIRGKLRWWFRILGGTPEQEAQIFGSTAGGLGVGSSLVVRVSDSAIKQRWQPVQFSAGSNTGYLLYFAKASQNGVRWNPRGALPPGTSFDLQLIWRRPIPEDAHMLFDLTLDAFLMLGALGLRSSRGLGCFETNGKIFTEDSFNALVKRIKSKAPGFLAGLGEFKGPEQQLFEALGGQLRGLRAGYSAGRPGRSNPTPLGASQPRQASAVHLRSVRLAADLFRVVVFEAPADRVLEPHSRRGAPRLGAGVPPPAETPPTSGRGYGGWRR